MKKCPYCGTEYPDEATVCSQDAQPLTDPAAPAEQRTTMAGVWRGVYSYAKDTGRAGRKPVRFTLKLKQGWLGHFTGQVTEDAPEGIPGTGTIDGYLGAPTIEFTKQMPVGYTRTADGTRMTLREYSVSQGRPGDHELPGPPIFYEGTFLDANRLQGMWFIRPGRIALTGGFGRKVLPNSGYWCAEFVTSDLTIDPTGGPAEAVYDASLLPQPEVYAPEATGMGSLGKFDVIEAEALLKKFEKAGLRFEITRDDSPIREMMPFTQVTGGSSGTARMIEIFVRPEDEATAVALMDDHKV